MVPWSSGFIACVTLHISPVGAGRDIVVVALRMRLVGPWVVLSPLAVYVSRAPALLVALLAVAALMSIARYRPRRLSLLWCLWSLRLK